MRKLIYFVPLSFVVLASLGCGKSGFKEFSPPDGNFSILMPGAPKQEEKTINGLKMIAYGSGWRGEEHWIACADIPPGMVGSLDGAVHGMCEAAGGADLKKTTRTFNGQGYVEYEFASTRYGGFVSGRGVIARNRLYLFFAMGKNEQLSNPETRKFIDSFELKDGPTPAKEEEKPAVEETPELPARPSKPEPRRSNSPSRPTTLPSDSGTFVLSPTPADSDPSPTPVRPGSGVAVTPSPQAPGGETTFNPAPARPGRPGRPTGPRQDQLAQPQMFGSPFGEDFTDSAPEGGLLIGFDIGLGYWTNSNNDCVVSLRPIYRLNDKDHFGKIFGTDIRRGVREVARPGYAVGAVTGKSTAVVDGLYITYMKVKGDQLDPNDVYHSLWIGGPGGNGSTTLSGDGKPIIGLSGKKNEKNILALGLQYGAAPMDLFPVIGQSKLPAPPRIPKAPRFIGGWNDPEFREEGPSGGILVGFEMGLGPLGNLVTVRGIYQVKDKAKDVPGQMHGTNTRNAGRDRARPGYAVGAISVKGGLWVDGMCITYMKIDGDKLDPTDSYQSPWFGKPGNAEDSNTITGDGTPVIGLLGRQNRNDMNALGLLFKGAETEKKPPEKK